MPVFDWHDPEAPRNAPPKRKYTQNEAHYWTVTDKGLDAAVEARRQAAQDNAYWNGLKPTLGKFAKEQQREAQRREKAATIWLDHFTKPGRKSILNMPADMAEELDYVWRAMVLAE